MEDKIKEIDTALNSLKRDEEQLIKEIDKFNGKYEIENGKLTEPREVTEYKRELEKIRAEIEQKNLQKRRYVLLRDKERLSDENVVKNLKNIYRNEKDADKMISEMLKKRSEEIESKLSEVETLIKNTDKPENKDLDIEALLKTMDERKKENVRQEEIIDFEDFVKEPEIEEIIEKEESKENEEETRNTIINEMNKEIEKMDEVIRIYKDLWKELDVLNLIYEESKKKIKNLQEEFGKVKLEAERLLRKKIIANTIKKLTETDLKRAKKEYETYEKENDEKLVNIKRNIENLRTRCETIKEEDENIDFVKKIHKRLELIRQNENKDEQQEEFAIDPLQDEFEYEEPKDNIETENEEMKEDTDYETEDEEKIEEADFEYKIEEQQEDYEKEEELEEFEEEVEKEDPEEIEEEEEKGESFWKKACKKFFKGLGKVRRRFI